MSRHYCHADSAGTAALKLDSPELESFVVGGKRGREQLIEDKGSDKTAAVVAVAVAAVDAGRDGGTVGGNDLHWALRRRCTCVGELRRCFGSFGRPWLSLGSWGTFWPLMNKA